MGYLGIAEDLTELMALEKVNEEQRLSMIHSSKMSALGEMAAGIAHEINNPLAVLISWTEIIKTQLQADSVDGAAILTSLGRVESTTLRIARIISALRKFSRDPSADPLEKFRLQEIVADAHQLCSERLKNSGIAVTIDVDPALTVAGRSVQISQVIMNLLMNANDAVSERADKWIKISAQNHGTMVELQVTDAGTGITPEVQEKMLRPFFTTKELGKGTGLGLSIARGIVEASGGELGYRLADGHTQFYFTLKNAQEVP